MSKFLAKLDWSVKETITDYYNVQRIIPLSLSPTILSLPRLLTVLKWTIKIKKAGVFSLVKVS